MRERGRTRRGSGSSEGEVTVRGTSEGELR